MRQRVTLPSHAKTTKPSTIHRSDFQLAEGKSDQPLLVSGHFIALTAHPKAKWNDLWLLTEVLHEGKQPQVLEESVTSYSTALKDDFHQGYRNRFQPPPWEGA